MGKNNYFQFKQFRIEQERSAMKVGVDGVLLGAWTDVSQTKNILDVGTGTGLIALMLAQRSNAQITAIEIEKNAALEAKENIAASPWKNRLEVVNIPFQEYATKQSQKFDLIVSNPPFFSNASKAASNERTLARHNDTLTFVELISYSASLLHEAGSLSLIIPAEAIEELNKLANNNQLYLKRLTQIKPKPAKNVNRILVQWSKTKQQPEFGELIIYQNDGSFTNEYIELTRDFYLKF